MSRPPRAVTLDPRLHDYQRRAVEHLHGTGEKGAGLFMDMGLGKTATVLQALTDDHLPALVVAPRRVADEVWDVEVAKWRPDLSVRKLTNLGATKAEKQGERRARMLLRDVDADVTVISRDQIGVMGERVHPYRTLVLDESSGYKNFSTNRHRDTRRVAKRVSHIWGLTGTPAPNGYLDLWAQIGLLDGGKRLGHKFTNYRRDYFDVVRLHKQTGQAIEWAAKPGAEDAINALLLDLCLSMDAKDYLELPDLTFNEVKVPLLPRVRALADKFREDLTVNLDILGDVSTANSATLSGRLRQLSAGFLYADHDTSRAEWLHDEKIKALVEIVDGTGSPLLVFYQFKEEARKILDVLRSRGTPATPIREAGSVRRWNEGEVPILLAHPESAGHGLNLQHGGHTMCYTSLPWGLEPWDQSVHRLHRQGQQNAVLVHLLLSPGMPDRDVLRSLINKESVQDGLMNYLKEGHLWL